MLNFHKTELLVSPAKVQEELPLPSSTREFIAATRKTLANILSGKDKRLLFIIGPCSIHHFKATLDYADRLMALAKKMEDRFFIVMRAYVEKPRSIVGWKGLLHDPLLNGSCQINRGIYLARHLLLELAKKRMPTAMEFLEPTTPHYLADLITWGSIGARTSLSQPHRQLASALPMPVGFKNTIDGNVTATIGAMIAARLPQTYLGLNLKGQGAIHYTQGNPGCHLVLRGGNGRINYDSVSVFDACQQLREHELTPRVIVDCSHGNCQKQYERQEVAFKNVVNQVASGSDLIAGLILESYLQAGSQPLPKDLSQLKSDVSLTDGCLDWQKTEELMEWAYGRLKKGRYQSIPSRYDESIAPQSSCS